MEALASHIIIIKLFLIVGAIAGYIWLGFKLTSVASKTYDYGMWNWVTILTMLYMAFTWVAFMFKIEGADQSQILIMQMSSVVAFLIIWIFNSIKTSFFMGLCISLYQTSVCLITFAIIMFTILSGFGFGGSSKD